MIRKLCRSCRLFVQGDECPICHKNQFTDSWQGRIYILDSNKSEIAKKIGITVKGEYAIKVR